MCSENPVNFDWTHVNNRDGIAVGRKLTAGGVIVTPLAERGFQIEYSVESTSPDVPLSVDELAELAAMLVRAAAVAPPVWEDQ